MFVFNRSAETREGVQVRVDTATLGLRVQDDGAVNATDLKGWSCKTELPMTWQAKGATGTLTLTIPPHDFRIILIAPADGAK